MTGAGADADGGADAAGVAGAMVLAGLDTTGATGLAGAFGAGVVGVAWLPEGAPVEEGRAGALVAGAGGLTGAAASGSGPADAGTAVPEPVPAEPAADATGDVAEATVEVTGDVAEATVEVTGDVAEATVEVTGDVAELTVEEALESVEVSVALRGDRAAVAAWAGRENSSMTTKMPAVASAACTATRAMRRAVGCMSSSHSTRNQVARLPSGGGANLAHTELLFGHHRTDRSPIGQGREVAAGSPNRPRSPAGPPEQGSKISLT
jgi:hypothetical protein